VESYEENIPVYLIS